MSGPTRLAHIDFLRGAAAILVLAGHLRAFLFQSFTELEQAGLHVGLLAKVFYFATGLGHEAVMVFFALSGFLVGGKAFEDILTSEFSWSRYLSRRLTRLWIVIVPTLVLTLVLDRVGWALTGGAGYDGRFYDLYLQGPRGPLGDDHSLLAFVGNLAFLQNIYVPVFGSNGPMWSLTNEFWYYIACPLVVWVALSAGGVRRIVGLAILLALIVVLPMWLIEGAIIWVAGAAAALFARRGSWLLRSIWLQVLAIPLLMGLMVAAKLPMLAIGDLALGLGVALILPVLVHLPNFGNAYTATARRLSDISFTLYLTHFPFLTLIIMGAIAPRRWPPGLEGAGLYALLLTAALVLAVCVWWCFERNTDRIYAAIRGRWPRATA